MYKGRFCTACQAVGMLSTCYVRMWRLWWP